MPRSSMLRLPSEGKSKSNQRCSLPRTSSKRLAEPQLTSCWDSRLAETTRMSFQQEVEEEEEEVAEEVPKMAAVKEVAGDKIQSRASRRPKRISQLYEYDIIYYNKELGRSSSFAVDGVIN